MRRAKLSDYVFVDTSVLVAELFVGTIGAKATNHFFDELQQAGVPIAFSTLLRAEYSQSCRRLATRPDRLPEETRTLYRLEEWASNPLIRQRWMSDCTRRLQRLLVDFAGSIELPFDESIWIESTQIMAVHSLESLDAVHIATARAFQVPVFATLDADFRRIDSPAIRLIRDENNTEMQT